MRQRKVKNLETKYAAFEDIIIDDPAAKRGSWRSLAQSSAMSQEIYLEIGCGKGKFISELAAQHPERLYIAIEGARSVLLRAMEKIKAKDLKNVFFVPHFIDDLSEWFADGEIDGIYLNFSDPLPKNCTAKRRLTHRSKLAQYFRVLAPDGIVTFKTDNTGLFEFTIQEIAAADLAILELTRDLHNCEYGEDDIRTEYEYKFSELGENIKRVKIGRKGGNMGAITSMAAENGRMIPLEDKIFGLNGRAKAAVAARGIDNVVAATVGSLLDDRGELIVLSSVDEAVKALTQADYAEYAPIAGTPGFKEAVKRAAFGSYQPKFHTEVVASPGGTGSIRLALSNYTCPGDKVLTHDWHWPTYASITGEQGRGLETFEMFTEDGAFNLEDFEYKVKKLLRLQDRLMIILNTPANNPTGYSLSDDDWRGVVRILNEIPCEKKVCLFVDVAYIDFAGEADEVRSFLPILETLNANVLPLLGYSASKTFTFYGFRCAALICMAKSSAVAEEFVRVCSYSARATWSNSPRAPQVVIDKIMSDEHLLARVDRERKEFRDMLLARGRAFEQAAAEAGLEMVPFRGGFFCSIPCDNPDALSRKLEQQDVYLVPFKRGIRVSIAAISMEKCRKLPAIIKAALSDGEKE